MNSVWFSVILIGSLLLANINHSAIFTSIPCEVTNDCQAYRCVKRGECKDTGYCRFSIYHENGKSCTTVDGETGTCNGESLECQIGTNTPTYVPITKSPVTARLITPRPTTNIPTTANPTNAGQTGQPTPAPSIASGLELLEPKVVTLLDGQTYTFAIAYCNFTVQGLFTASSRCYCMYDSIKNEAYDCSIPGPTLKLFAGSTPIVIFKNLFTGLAESANGEENKMDGTNVHTHGLHVSSLSDDPMLTIRPQSEHRYAYEIPEDHYPGNHWYHAHTHGSTAYHVHSGEYGAILMDYPEDHPSNGYELQEYEYTLMVFSDMWVNTECDCEVVNDNGLTGDDHRYLCDPNLSLCYEEHSICYQYCMFDDELKESSGYQYYAHILLDQEGGGNGEDNRIYYFVNGQHEPILTIEKGVYRRLLFVNANAQHYMEWTLKANGCEWNLLGYDGIWFSEMRDLSESPYNNMFLLSPGGRAEILLVCNELGETEIRSSNDSAVNSAMPRAEPHHLFTLNVVEPSLNNGKTEPPDMSKLPPKPAYLYDLTGLETGQFETECPCSAVVDPDTSCHWDYALPEINGRVFTDATDSIYYELQLNSVYEFAVGNHNVHPHHQHVVPFQLQTDHGPNGFLGKAGDWFDVLGGGSYTMRMNASRFECDVVLHCHLLEHEDKGMMQLFRITDMANEGGQCTLKTIEYNKHFLEEQAHWSEQNALLAQQDQVYLTNKAANEDTTQ